MALGFSRCHAEECLEDPTILSGSLRSTLDVFDEFEDVEIVSHINWLALGLLLIIENHKFEALRRVHLIPSEGVPEDAVDAVNANVFRDLDFSVSEGGENFSAG